MNDKSLGLLEATCLVRAIDVADHILKKVPVSYSIKQYPGLGLVTIAFRGPTSHIKEAVESGTEFLKQAGAFHSSTQILSPEKELLSFFTPSRPAPDPVPEKEPDSSRSKLDKSVEKTKPVKTELKASIESASEKGSETNAVKPKNPKKIAQKPKNLSPRQEELPVKSEAEKPVAKPSPVKQTEKRIAKQEKKTEPEKSEKTKNKDPQPTETKQKEPLKVEQEKKVEPVKKTSDDLPEFLKQNKDVTVNVKEQDATDEETWKRPPHCNYICSLCNELDCPERWK